MCNCSKDVSTALQASILTRSIRIYVLRFSKKVEGTERAEDRFVILSFDADDDAFAGLRCRAKFA